MKELSAADWAFKQVEAVREEPSKRLELLERTYHGPTGRAPHHLPFRRAAMAFVNWLLKRGVLESKASPWWRAVNERLLRDGCEAGARSGGRGGAASSRLSNSGWISLLIHAGEPGIELTTPLSFPLTWEIVNLLNAKRGRMLFP